MKKTLDELLNDVKSIEMNDDIRVKLLEDLSDSFEPGESTVDLEKFVDKSEFDELTNNYNDLQKRYIARFGEKVVEEPKDSDEELLKDKTVIDIKEV